VKYMCYSPNRSHRRAELRRSVNAALDVGGQRAQRGDALSDVDAPFPPLSATRDTTLVAYLVDLAALLHAPGR
jgi:hypothetical protein